MQGKLIDQMAGLALQYPDVDMCNLYNMLMRSVRDADVDFVSKHFALMLTVAREARNAPQDIQRLILTGY